MGQKFSHLRGIFGGMDNGENPILSVNCSTTMSVNEGNDHNNDGTDVRSSLLPQRSTSNQLRTNSNARTVEMTDNIFENIYSNGSEVSKPDEENGNVSMTEASTSSRAGSVTCTCPRQLEHCVCDQAVGYQNKSIATSLHNNVEDVGASYLREESSRTASLVSSKRTRAKSLRSSKDIGSGGKKKRNHWVLKFNCARLKSGSSCGGAGVATDIPEPNLGCNSCVCTGYRRTEEHHLGAGVVFEAASKEQSHQINSKASSESSSSSEDISAAPPDLLIDMVKFNPEVYPVEDCDERARLERAREIAEGVEPPPGFCPGQHIQLICPPALTLDNLTALFQTHLGIHPAALTALSQIDVTLAPAIHRGVHTQVDYIHCLVPDILQITSCSFYWGKMDRYEAERLLEGRPEGTFLLRDSAQEEYLFSVSFRKYGRSLHARIEQWNHHFSFDSHDPGVFASPTVCGLIEHYKDPSCCMFFEPMLTIPLHRNFPFPLQHLCRAAICSKATYDGVNQLQLPKPLKGYLKEYHYKQRVRVRIFDFEP